MFALFHTIEHLRGGRTWMDKKSAATDTQQSSKGGRHLSSAHTHMSVSARILHIEELHRCVQLSSFHSVRSSDYPPRAYPPHGWHRLRHNTHPFLLDSHCPGHPGAVVSQEVHCGGRHLEQQKHAAATRGSIMTPTPQNHCYIRLVGTTITILRHERPFLDLSQ